MRKRIFSLALVVALLLSSAGGRAGSVQAGIDIWTQTSQGIWGGSIGLLAISPNYATDRTIFAETSEGVFKSTNGGSSWTEVNTGLPYLCVRALAISPNYASDNTIFAITEWCRGAVGTVYKSTDGGDSWDKTGLADIYGMRALAISPNYASDNTIFAGTSRGVFKSTDGGSSWTEVNTGLTNLSVLSLAISPNYASDNTIFAGTYGGVFKSTNGGDSWSDSGLTGLRVRALAISPNYASDNTIFAGTHGAGVFKSTNGGDSWTEVNTGLTNLSVHALAISPNYPSDNTIFAGTGAGVFKSTNGGDSWSDSGLTGPAVRALAICPNYASDNTIFAGTSRGAFKSTDGGSSWAEVNSGLTPLDVQVLAISPNYPSDNTIFAGTHFPGVFKSTDGGDSWDYALTNGSFELGPRIPVPWKGKNLTAKDRRVCRIRILGSCAFKMVGTGAKKSLRQVVNISGNAGDTFFLTGWSKAENPLRRGGSYCLVARVFHTDGTKKSYRRCFAKRTHGWQRREKTFTVDKDYNKIVVSLRYNRQGGKAWFDGVGLVRPPVGSLAYVRALGISPNYAADNTIFAGTYGGVFKSTNGGDSWTEVNTGLTGLRVSALAISPNYASDSTIFAGTGDGGFFKSTDGGSSWSAMNAGLGSLGILALALTPTAPHTIFAGTYGSGVWQYTMSGNSAD